MLKKIPFLLVLAIVGCKSKPTLVGDWTGTATVNGTTQSADYKFNPDKTMTIQSEQMGMKTTLKATYKEEEKSFSMKITDLEIPGLPEAMQKQAKEGIANQKETTFSVEWKSADEVNLVPDAAQAGAAITMNLKRRK